MVRLSFVSLSFVFALFCADVMGAGGSDIYPDCTVAEVISVYDGVRFSCKAGGGDVLDGLRLKVSVRGVENTTDKIAAARFVADQLAKAKRVDLKKVYMRNYFRVVADVYVDGESLADILVMEGMARWQGVGKGPQMQVKIAERSRNAGEFYGETSRPSYGRGVDMEVFEPEMRLEDALDIIRTSVQPTLPIIVMWSEMESNAFVDKDTPIGFSGSGTMTPGGALRLLLSSIDEIGIGLQYAINDGVITIASDEMELKKRYLRVYDMSALVADRYSMGMGYGNRGRNNGRSSYGNNGYGSGNSSFGSGNNSFGNSSFGNSNFGNSSFGNSNRDRNTGTSIRRPSSGGR